MKRVITNNPIFNVKSSFSDFNISNLFRNASSNLNQLSLEYHNDQKKLNILLNNIINNQIIFRDACIDPTIKANQLIIEAHFKYLFSPYTTDNAQLRGLQVHLSTQMFRDFGQAGNNVNYTCLNAEYLSNLVKPKSPYNIFFAKTSRISSPNSFQEAVETVGGKMYSSITPGIDNVHITGDDSSVITTIKQNVVHTQFINNIPSFNTNGDYVRETVFSSGRVLSTTDNKSQGIGLVFHPIKGAEPRVMNVGTVDPVLIKKINIDIATKAINGSLVSKSFSYNIVHLDPKQNNPQDILASLKKAQQTGKIEDLIDLAGIPVIISNDNNQ